MNIRYNHDHNDAFDGAMRELHAQALTQVSPQTRTRLRAARAAAATRQAPTRGLRWALATGFVAVFALAIGLQWRGPSSTANLPTQTAAIEAANDNTGGSVEVLDENPDFYLWLASNDSLPVAMER